MDEYCRFVAAMILVGWACRIRKIKKGSKEEAKLHDEVFEKMGLDEEKLVRFYSRVLLDVEQVQKDADMIAGITKTEAVYGRVDKKKIKNNVGSM